MVSEEGEGEGFVLLGQGSAVGVCSWHSIAWLASIVGAYCFTNPEHFFGVGSSMMYPVAAVRKRNKRKERRAQNDPASLTGVRLRASFGASREYR